MIETQSTIVQVWMTKNQDEVVVAIILSSKLPLAAALSLSLFSEHLTFLTPCIHTQMTLTLIDIEQPNQVCDLDAGDVNDLLMASEYIVEIF